VRVSLDSFLLKRASVRFHAKLGLRILNSLRRKFPARLTGHPSVHLESERVCTHLMSSTCQNHSPGNFCFTDRKHGPFTYYSDPRDPSKLICESCRPSVLAKLRPQHPLNVPTSREESDTEEQSPPRKRALHWSAPIPQKFGQKKTVQKKVDKTSGLEYISEEEEGYHDK